MEKNAKNAMFFCKEQKRTQRTQRALLQRTEKNARTFRSFAKECENVPFFFQYIYIEIYIDTAGALENGTLHEFFAYFIFLNKNAV